MSRSDFLIVGGGVAGTTAAETLRRLRPSARITLVAKESFPLYSRVLLPHVVKGKVPRERAFLRTTKQYEEKGIEIIAGREVTRCVPSTRSLTLDDGTECEYSTLLLATGGDALPLGVPGDTLRGVLPFRTLTDTDRILEELALVRDLPEEERQAAVVGAGFIGLEFPPFFEKYGIATTLFIRGPRYWWRLFDEDCSSLLEDAFMGHGVKIVRGAEIVGCEGNAKRVSRVVLKDGRTFPAALVGYGVGITGAPTWVLDAGVAGGSYGIQADSSLKTNVPHIWAAGDCAFFEDVTVGRTHRLGNWLNAQEQGRYAAEAMCGERAEPFRALSAYSTQIFGLTIGFLGDLTDGPGSVWINRGNRDQGIARLHLRSGRIVGAALLNRLAERGVVTELIKGAISFVGKERLLGDTSRALDSL